MGCVVCMTCVFLQAYHSAFNDEKNRTIAGMAILPLKTSFKGPAPRAGAWGERGGAWKENVCVRGCEDMHGSGRTFVLCH